MPAAKLAALTMFACIFLCPVVLLFEIGCWITWIWGPSPVIAQASLTGWAALAALIVTGATARFIALLEDV